MGVMRFFKSWRERKRKAAAEDRANARREQITEYGDKCRQHPGLYFVDFADLIAELYLGDDAEWNDLAQDQKDEALSFFRLGLTKCE